MTWLIVEMKAEIHRFQIRYSPFYNHKYFQIKRTCYFVSIVFLIKLTAISWKNCFEIFHLYCNLTRAKKEFLKSEVFNCWGRNLGLDLWKCLSKWLQNDTPLINQIHIYCFYGPFSQWLILFTFSLESAVHNQMGPSSHRESTASLGGHCA